MSVKATDLVPVPAAGEDLGAALCSQQQGKFLCWAACIEMSLAGTRQQCAVVNVAFPGIMTDCCNDIFGDCDRRCPEDQVPTAFANNGMMASPVKKQDVDLSWLRQAVSDGSLVAVVWKGDGSNHMVLVVRVSQAADLLLVCDPDRFEISKMTFGKLQEPDGRWTGWTLEWVWRVSRGGL